MARKNKQPVDTYEEQEGYDEYEDEEYDDEEASRRASKGCFVAFLIALALVVAAAGIGFLWVRGEIGGKHSKAEEAQVIEVVSGDTTRSIGNKLDEAELIGNSTVWRTYIKFFYKGDVDFKAGSFEIEPGMSYESIIKTLNQPPNIVRTARLRIPEGTTVMAVAKEFADAGLAESAEEFLMVADDLERYSDIPFIQKLLEDFDPDEVFHPSEGLLFPDTYEFYLGDTVENMVRKVYEEMDSKFTPEVYAALEENNMSVREILVLASIVQAEAGDEDQQPYVSDVIWNRLGTGWSQQTLGVDVTLKYVRQYMQWTDDDWWNTPRSQISYSDAREYVGEKLFYAYVTQDDDPNSRKGLPAGPICSISHTALLAAVSPEAKDGMTYYYFLTTLLGNYYYAETYNGHLANIDTMYRENAEFEKQQAEAENAQDGGSAEDDDDGAGEPG